jgi:hypothetical protein
MLPIAMRAWMSIVEREYAKMHMISNALVRILGERCASENLVVDFQCEEPRVSVDVAPSRFWRMCTCSYVLAAKMLGWSVTL